MVDVVVPTTADITDEPAGTALVPIIEGATDIGTATWAKVKEWIQAGMVAGGAELIHTFEWSNSTADLSHTSDKWADYDYIAFLGWHNSGTATRYYFDAFMPRAEIPATDQDYRIGAGGRWRSVQLSGTTLTLQSEANTQYGRIEVWGTDSPFGGGGAGNGNGNGNGNGGPWADAAALIDDIDDDSGGDVNFSREGSGATANLRGTLRASGTRDGTTFLRGDGTWATPPSAPGSGAAVTWLLPTNTYRANFGSSHPLNTRFFTSLVTYNNIITEDGPLAGRASNAPASPAAGDIMVAGFRVTNTVASIRTFVYDGTQWTQSALLQVGVDSGGISGQLAPTGQLSSGIAAWASGDSYQYPDVAAHSSALWLYIGDGTANAEPGTDAAEGIWVLVGPADPDANNTEIAEVTGETSTSGGHIVHGSNDTTWSAYTTIPLHELAARNTLASDLDTATDSFVMPAGNYLARVQYIQTRLETVSEGAVASPACLVEYEDDNGDWQNVPYAWGHQTFHGTDTANAASGVPFDIRFTVRLETASRVRFRAVTIPEQTAVDNVGWRFSYATIRLMPLSGRVGPEGPPGGDATQVEANPTEAATETLRTIEVAGTVYSVPDETGEAEYGTVARASFVSAANWPRETEIHLPADAGPYDIPDNTEVVAPHTYGGALAAGDSVLVHADVEFRDPAQPDPTVRFKLRTGQADVTDELVLTHGMAVLTVSGAQAEAAQFRLVVNGSGAQLQTLDITVYAVTLLRDTTPEVAEIVGAYVRADLDQLLSELARVESEIDRGGLPAGGHDGQVLERITGGYDWVFAPTGIPGHAGEIVTREGAGYRWRFLAAAEVTMALGLVPGALAANVENWIEYLRDRPRMPVAYSDQVTYFAGEEVIHDSKVWECLQEALNQTPGSQPAYWSESVDFAAGVQAWAKDASTLIPVAKLGSGTATATKFLRGDGTWAAPPAADGAGLPSGGAALQHLRKNAANDGEEWADAPTPRTNAEIDARIEPQARAGNTSKWTPGRLGTGSPDATMYLRGDGQWQAFAAAVNALVNAVARAGNIAVWPVSKLGTGSPDGSKFLRGDGVWSFLTQYRGSLVFGSEGPGYEPGDWGQRDGGVYVCTTAQPAASAFAAANWKRLDNVATAWADITGKPTIPTLRTGPETADLLEGLTGDERLDYSALRGAPTIPTVPNPRRIGRGQFPAVDANDGTWQYPRGYLAPSEYEYITIPDDITQLAIIRTQGGVAHTGPLLWFFRGDLTTGRVEDSTSGGTTRVAYPHWTTSGSDITFVHRTGFFGVDQHDRFMWKQHGSTSALVFELYGM